MCLGNNVMRLRKKEKLSQKELESTSTVPQSSISRIEKGCLSNPGIETIRKLATALNVTVNDLLDNEKSNTKNT